MAEHNNTHYGRLPETVSCSPKIFRSNMPDSKLADLENAIEAGKVGPTTYESLQPDRRYGVNSKWLQNAKQAWLDFNWKQTETEINSFPNYHVDVRNGDSHLNVHFMALFSERKAAIPILMLHGWPGSFMEFLPILRLLAQKYTPATLPYHTIVPSLPGYGFSSSPPLNRDFFLQDCAEIMDTLMVQLSFEAGYIVQGGDVGSKVARVLGGIHPRAKAIHLNFCIMQDPGIFSSDQYTAIERQALCRSRDFHSTGTAYALAHATRPSTIGLVLSSNPLALLAWVGEKMLAWTDIDPPLQTILAHVSLYWLTDTISTSLWPYRQSYSPGSIDNHAHPPWHIDKPLGFSWFPKENGQVPRKWIETTGNLVFFRRHESGGHFAALEMPEALLKDLEDFVDQVRGSIQL